MAAILAGWYVYHQRAPLSDSPLSEIEHLSPVQALPDISTTTTVYSWRDAQGETHISNEPPPAAGDVQVWEYRSDQNVIPSTQLPFLNRREAADSSSAGPVDTPTGMFGGYRDALDDARRVRQTMDERNQEMDQAVREQ